MFQCGSDPWQDACCCASCPETRCISDVPRTTIQVIVVEETMRKHIKKRPGTVDDSPIYPRFFTCFSQIFICGVLLQVVELSHWSQLKLDFVVAGLELQLKKIQIWRVAIYGGFHQEKMGIYCNIL